MKKLLALLLALSFTLSMVLPAGMAEEKPLKIVTTIFPIYDWVRQILGDRDADVTMLMDSGVDLHNFQPTAQDILTIAQCDLFIFVGGESDEWTEDVLTTTQNEHLTAINLLDALGDEVKEEEIVEGMEHEHDHVEDEDHEDEDHDEHDHDEDEDHDEHDHDEDEDHEEHEHEADEHVWLSLRNAEKLVQAIAGTIANLDPDQADLYHTNAKNYIEKLQALDAQYAETVNAAAFKTLLFGDRFPFRYLADDYGLTYYAAFAGCSAETEASFQTILFLAQKLDELGLPAVLTIENPKTRIAETVVNATQKKNQKILSLNSMQGVTAQEVKDGAAYLSLMENNLIVLRDALN